LRGLGVFLGLPARHNDNTCWLIDFYDNFALVFGGLGPSWGILGGSWGFMMPLESILGTAWRSLGELLGAFVPHSRFQDAIFCIIYHVQKKCSFLQRERDIQQLQASWRLLVCLFGSLGSLLEALGTLLEHLRCILAFSWEPCWPLGSPEGEHVFFFAGSMRVWRARYPGNTTNRQSSRSRGVG